ncbi:hypothetical protein K3495_g3185 [Podosphaera aphanis]|nr:hypothetical protein K3495_g3185 [Podosphaera aphanis]
MGSITQKFGSLTKALKDALDWRLDEGTTFDPAKVKLQHFSRKRTDKNPVNTPSVTHGVFSVSEKTNRPYTRWLGVYFDRTLSFKWHVRFLANKALVVGNALRSLGNTLRDVPLKLLRQAVTACVLPIACYGAETWWPGLTHAISPTRTVSILVKGHLSSKKLEAGLSPPEIALDIKLRQAFLLIHRFDPRHPLRRRNIWVLSQQRRVSRLSRWALYLPPTEYLDPLVSSPWLAKKSWCSKTRRVTRASCCFPESIPLQDMVIYLDGGHLESDSGPRVEGGSAILQAGRVIFQKRIALSPSFETFDAEAAAVLTALETAIDIPSVRFANNLWVLLDNLDVARQLLSIPTCSSQELFSRFASKAREWPQRSRLPRALPGGVKIHWILGHSGITGNTLADEAAKEAMNMPPPHLPRLHLPLQKLRSVIRQQQPIKNTGYKTHLSHTRTWKLTSARATPRSCHYLGNMPLTYMLRAPDMETSHHIMPASITIPRTIHAAATNSSRPYTSYTAV